MRNQIDPGEVILEFVRIGGLIRVSAMEAEKPDPGRDLRSGERRRGGAAPHRAAQAGLRPRAPRHRAPAGRQIRRERLTAATDSRSVGRPRSRPARTRAPAAEVGSERGGVAAFAAAPKCRESLPCRLRRSDTGPSVRYSRVIAERCAQPRHRRALRSAMADPRDANDQVWLCTRTPSSCVAPGGVR